MGNLSRSAGLDWCPRFSPHYYNTEDEVARMVSVVAELRATS
ncbi:hypothetical protein AB0P21_01660 [Kribbella sp. NPDC056861]